MKKALSDFVDMVRFLFEIWQWKETWILPGLACLIVWFWLVFAFALLLPNPWRAIIIWGEILGLAVLAPRRRSP